MTSPHSSPPPDTPSPAAQLTRLRAALAGRYTIERELGRGGMATVYLADDLKHHRKVALKVLRPELGSLLGPARFAREIEMAAGLSHPFIVPLYDSGEADGFLFYVMPWLSGESLRQRLARTGPLPVEEAVAITRRIASALGHAHARGLIHRDIKPENVLFHEGEAMVTDFGIALDARSAAGTRLTGTGFLVGTPDYMSPEQSAGEQSLDERSDIYSLGCVLYEMLAGEPPFAGPTAQAVMARRFIDPVPSIRRARPAVPQGLDAALRRALARDPGDRFHSAAALAAALTATGAASPPSPSVAVLPFRNLSSDPENEYFADGITEDVIAQLSRIRSLKVISRGSVMQFKQREQSLHEIGAMLGVTTLLEGSVRKAGGRVRIVGQLIDAETDRNLWSETYDRDLTDIFAIQSDVALQIATALQAELTQDERARIRREPTHDMEAYQHYLLGRHCLVRWTDEGIAQGIKHLEQAVGRDPEYALAHATIAYAYADMGVGVAGSLSSSEAFRRAKAAVARALSIDGGLAEAHAVLGHLKYACDYDWDGAEAELKRAIELNPNSGDAHDIYGLLLSALERYDEAIEMQQRAHELDPLAHRMDVVTTYLRAGRYDTALDAVTRVLEVEPHLPLAHATLGWVLFLKGKRDEGIAELRQALALAPESTLYLSQLGQALGLTGQTREAREIVARLESLAAQRYVSPYHMAYVHTGLGDLDVAMDWLERAYNERAGGVFGVKGSFLFVPLRGHPRFQGLLRKMNLLPA